MCCLPFSSVAKLKKLEFHKSKPWGNFLPLGKRSRDWCEVIDSGTPLDLRKPTSHPTLPKRLPVLLLLLSALWTHEYQANCNGQCQGTRSLSGTCESPAPDRVRSKRGELLETAAWISFSFSHSQLAIVTENKKCQIWKYLNKEWSAYLFRHDTAHAVTDENDGILGPLLQALAIVDSLKWSSAHLRWPLPFLKEFAEQRMCCWFRSLDVAKTRHAGRWYDFRYCFFQPTVHGLGGRPVLPPFLPWCMDGNDSKIWN